MHNAAKIVMGAILSSFRLVTNHPGTVLAGVVVRQDDDGTLTTTFANGEVLGISCGKELSDIGRTNIVRAGLRVPIRLTASFTPVVGTQVHVSKTTGLAIAEDTGETPATFPTNGVYKTGPLTAILEDGTEVAAGAAEVDMAGGL